MDGTLVRALEVIANSPKYNAWVFSHFKDHLSGVVLDVGSGLGDLAAFYDQPSVDRIILTDYSRVMVERLRQRFQTPKAKYRVERLDVASADAVSRLQPEGVASIISLNVLEHIPNDRAALQNMSALLPSGGKLLLMVPALPAIHGTLDDLAGHSRRYTKEGLAQIVVDAGFRIKNVHYVNFLGIVTWFIAGKILRQKQFNPKACQALDKIVPVLRFFESWLKPFIGQSLVLIADKV